MDEGQRLMTEPIGYLNYGWSFLRSAEHVYSGLKSDQLNLRFDAPAIVLVGHGFELILKAYSWHATGELVAKRHDLCWLLGLANSNGLNLSISEPERQALCHLNLEVGGKPFRARYLETGVSPAPNIEEWLAIGRKLMDAVESVLAPDRIKNVGRSTEIDPPPNYPKHPQPLSEEQAIEILAELFEKELNQ